MRVRPNVLRRGRVLIGGLVLACQTLSIPQLSANDDNGNAVVDTFIAAHARKLHGEEYREARRTVSGDLNHGGQADLAVQYTLESMGGSNVYRFSLAVFLNRRGRYVYAASRQVGGKLQRDVTLRAIKDDKVLFDTLEYEPGTPVAVQVSQGTLYLPSAANSSKNSEEAYRR
jgi:hypothetical protein